MIRMVNMVVMFDKVISFDIPLWLMKGGIKKILRIERYMRIKLIQCGLREKIYYSFMISTVGNNLMKKMTLVFNYCN